MSTTTLYVTHDQTEAMTMADRVVVMNGGAIEQIGRPMELYRRPRTRFVAEFIGSPGMNFFEGTLVIEDAAMLVVLPQGPRLSVPEELRAASGALVGEPVTLGLRPEAIAILDADADTATSLPAQARVVEPLGVETLVYVDIGENRVCARVAPDRAPREGENIRLGFDMTMMHLIDPRTGLVAGAAGYRHPGPIGRDPSGLMSSSLAATMAMPRRSSPSGQRPILVPDRLTPKNNITIVGAVFRPSPANFSLGHRDLGNRISIFRPHRRARDPCRRDRLDHLRA